MKKQAVIINLSLSHITDKNTGEIKDLTNITYTYPREDTERFVGPAVLECAKMGNLIPKLKGYIMKPVQIDITEILQDRGAKYTITKVNDIDIECT